MSDWRERAEAIGWKARAEAAEAKLHELSVKYTVTLDQNREMREALKDVEFRGSHQALTRLRAALAHE